MDALKHYLRDLKEQFYLSQDDFIRIMSDFHSEMQKGLAGKKCSLKMLPAFIGLPRGEEKGRYLALDLGGTNFRILLVELNGARRASVLASQHYTLKKQHLLSDTPEPLFGFIAEKIIQFIKRYTRAEYKPKSIGFTFSFPVEQKSISSGRLVKWTKGFDVGGVVGKDVVRLLNSFLKKRQETSIGINALINDTVGTLIMSAYSYAGCDLGVILGTGTNACYCERIANIGKLKGSALLDDMIINIEWGNFNKIPQNKFDIKLDRCSNNPGEQQMEKMVSGMYLGHLAGMVIADCMSKTGLLRGRRRGFFLERFRSEYMSLIENDNSRYLRHISDFLRGIGIDLSGIDDRKTLKSICRLVSTRSSAVAAASIASVIAKIDPGIKKNHIVAIDGSLYEKYPFYHRRMRSFLRAITKSRSSNIKLMLAKDGSGKGAAIVSAMVAD